MSGEGFLFQLGKLRTDLVAKRRAFRKAEDELLEAEHKFQEAVIRYNDSLPKEAPAPVPPAVPTPTPTTTKPVKGE